MKRSFLCILLIALITSCDKSSEDTRPIDPFKQWPVRESSLPPIDENNPENLVSLKAYLEREQYGDWSLWDCGEFIATSNRLEVGHPPAVRDKFFAMLYWQMRYAAPVIKYDRVYYLESVGTNTLYHSYNEARAAADVSNDIVKMHYVVSKQPEVTYFPRMYSDSSDTK